MKYFSAAVRFKLFMTVLLGLAYPLSLTGIGQLAFPNLSSGNFIYHQGNIVGSDLIGQKFEKPQYFWSRPSAVDYNPLASGGSNFGQTSAELKKIFDARKANLMANHEGVQEEPPQDLLFASGSGLDPHISLEAALFQKDRVAKNRKMSPEQIQALIETHLETRTLGIFGEPTVHVLKLNLALDQWHE